MTLVGHSMGAVLAALVAAARPRRASGLVLVEPPSALASAERTTVERLTAQLDYLAETPSHPVFSDVSAAAERLRRFRPALNADMALRMAARLTEPCTGGVRWRWDAALGTRAGFDGTLPAAGFDELLSGLAIPVLVVYSDRADNTGSRSAARLSLPGARQVSLRGGHDLHLDAPEEVAELIKDVTA